MTPKRRTLAALFVVLTTTFAYTQNKLDSIFTQIDDIIYSDIYTASDLIYENENLAESDDDVAQIAKRKAITARIKAKYSKALSYNLEALHIFEKNQNLTEIAEVYHNMGYLMRYIKDYDNSLEYYHKAIEIRDSLNEKKNLALSHREIGVIHRKKKDYEKALHHYDIAASLFHPTDDINEITTLQGNYATLYSMQRKYEMAIKMDKSALHKIKHLNNPKSLATRYGNIAIAYRKLKDYDKAIAYIDSALQVSREAHLLEPQVRYYEAKGRIRYKQKEFKKSYICLRKYKKLNDSLSRMSNLTSIENQVKSFEYEKRILRDSIDMANTTAMLERSVSLEKLKRRNLMLYGLLISLLLLSAILWQLNRIRTSKLQTKNDQLAAKVLQNKLQTTSKENRRLLDHSELQVEFKKSILDKVDKIVQENQTPDTKIRDLRFQLLEQLRLENQSTVVNNSIELKPAEFEEILRNKFPELTKGERKLCFLVRSGLTIKEIARINETSPTAVQSMRYRVRKKLNLSKGEELQAVLLDIL